MSTKSVQNQDTWTLEEAVEWLHDAIAYMTEAEQERVATPSQIAVIVKVAEQASRLLESSE